MQEQEHTSKSEKYKDSETLLKRDSSTGAFL